MRSNATSSRLSPRGEDEIFAPRRAGGLDFARLLRRVRATSALMPHQDGHDAIVSAPPSGHAGTDPIDPIDVPPDYVMPAAWFDGQRAGGFVEAVAHSEAQSAALCSAIATHVAGFCANPAVLSRGNWMLRVTLNPDLLPHCVLQLDLSYLRLVLRFETRDADTRAIVLRHVDVLKANLSTMLQRHAMVYDLEITVW